MNPLYGQVEEYTVSKQTNKNIILFYIFFCPKFELFLHFSSILEKARKKNNVPQGHDKSSTSVSKEVLSTNCLWGSAHQKQEEQSANQQWRHTPHTGKMDCVVEHLGDVGTTNGSDNGNL